MIRAVLAVARRPSLWSTAVRQLRRTAAPRWWTRPPFVPRPPDDYLRFRLLTQYGDSEHSPEPADVVNYLAWCKRWHDHR
ncbi:MAG TPA: hypothetical protein VFV63_03975 [Ilumatobacteraceae bacterium]|nr:hypothetical protein [Ilumatobacteraceae bacterium]